VPVSVGRRPAEEPDDSLRAFFGHLLAAVAPGLRRGDWGLATVRGWPDNQSCDHLAAWTWTASDQRHLVVVNFSDQRADGLVQLPWPDLRGRSVECEDLLRAVVYERDGTELASDGLYVALDAHQTHLLRVIAR
jgi:hypothetical protein